MASSRRLHARSINTFPTRGAPFCRRGRNVRSGRVFPPRPAGRICVLAALMAFVLCYATGIMQFGWIAGIAFGWLPAIVLAWGTAQVLYRCFMSVPADRMSR